MIPAFVGVLLALVSVAAPSPVPRQVSEPAQDRILLIGGRTFAESQRVIEALDAMVAASGVVGSSRFELLPGACVTDEGLAETLSGRADLRAIIAVVGDLSLMRGVDPNRDIPQAQRELSSRQIDERRLTTAMDRLEDCARRLGTRLVFATAPLGMQGRVETPELLRVEGIVRKRTPGLDLAAAFRTRESASLFANGIDRLDRLGHEEAARVIFHRLCRDETLLPPRNDDERLARAGQRALDAWLSGDQPPFRSAMTEATRFTPGTRLGQLRQAALYAARDGLGASCDRWAAAGPASGPCATPGLPLARILCKHTREPQASCDPLEQEILEVASLLLNGQTLAAWELASGAVDRFPDRLEAWITLMVISSAAGRTPVRIEDGPLPNLGATAWSPVSEARAVWTLRKGVAAGMSLPVLLVASAPYAELTPTGPILERLKREYRQGMHASALNIWSRDTRGLRIPPAWHIELERLKATPRN